MALKKIVFAILVVLGLSFSGAALATDGEYSPKLQTPNFEKEKLLSTLIGIQGLVYCRSGSQFIPLEGAVARITCEGVDEFGYETESFSILSGATDAKGYFIATISPHEVKDKKMRLRQCKAFLELSPSDDCDAPTNVNRGLTGAPLTSYRLLQEKNMKLFTVGPFFFVPQQDLAKSSSPDGYN